MESTEIEKTKLLRECLVLMNLFDYEPLEDSSSKSVFTAELNEDAFFELKFELEKILKKGE